MTMSLWDELLPKLTHISDEFAKNIKDTLDLGLAALDDFEKDTLKRPGVLEKNDNSKLVAINEDEDETNTPPKVAVVNSADETKTTQESDRGGKKRNKDELGNNTPDQDKRHKRSASVRAQGIISKQVNVNLSAKLRRPQDQEDDKENRTENVPMLVQVKQEKISILPEPAPSEVPALPTKVTVKEEADEEKMAMPPPVAPALKSRRNNTRKKPETEKVEDTPSEEPASRRSTRNRKQTDTAPPPTERRTRASSRATSQAQEEDMPPPPPPEPRPKRTRARKQQPQPEAEAASESEAEQTQQPVVDPNEKPRPKRTRKGKKMSAAKPEESPKAESRPQSPTAEQTRADKTPLSSPVISAPAKKLKKSIEKIKSAVKETEELKNDEKTMDASVEIAEPQGNIVDLEETRLLSRDTIDKPESTNNAQRASAEEKPDTPQANMNETIVISKAPALNETVVLSAIGSDQMTNDSSLMTSDGAEEIADTPPRSMIPVKLPTSAVKERVQQFEQLASSGGSTGPRLTRTKTRALAKQSSDPEKVSPREEPKATLSAATLAKLHALPPKNNTLTSSATKPRTNIVTSVKSFLPSASKPAPPKQEEKEREDARKKKEAMLEAKREEQRRRREQKMAAAAAARSAQERERAAQLSARAQCWQEKQALADQGRLEKIKENERKKQLLAAKVAETEERRRAEEAARVARLEDEQRQAEASRKRLLEEAERIRREEQKNEREMQLARQQYLEKQKKILEQLHTPMAAQGTPSKQMAPVHMADGFQYLNSDSEDEDRPKRTPPDWSRTKARMLHLQIQELIPASHVDKLFSVQYHTPDLTELFPAIDRRALKRTSSAVWRTPPSRLPGVQE